MGIYVSIFFLVALTVANGVYTQYVKKLVAKYKKDCFYAHGAVHGKVDILRQEFNTLRVDVSSIQGDMSVDNEIRGRMMDNLDRLKERVAALENEKVTVEKLAQEASDKYQAEVSSLLGYSGSKGREDS